MYSTGELNQKHLAASGHGQAPAEEICQCSAMTLTLTMIHDLSARLQEIPLLYDLGCDEQIRIIFRHSKIDCDGFLDDYKEIIAVISMQWPMTIYGEVDNNEVGEMKAVIDEQKKLYYSLYNVSGKSFHSLMGICLSIKLECPDSREFLKEAIQGMGPQSTCIPIHQRWIGFCRDNKIFNFCKDTRFCYLLSISDGNWQDMLHCLSIAQKEELWQSFLEDGISSLEFQWLLEAFNKRQVSGLLEWELALRRVLYCLGIKVVNEQGNFHVEDVEGKILRFQFNSLLPAEKMFLKILFPIGHY